MKAIVAFGFVSLLSSAAVLAEDSPYYVGTSAFAATGGKHIDTIGAGLALQFGYRISPNWAIEADHHETLQKLKYSDDTNTFCCGSGPEFDVNTTAVFGVFRTNDDLYFKAKAGFNLQDSNFQNSLAPAFGLGGGYKITPNTHLELEWEKYSSSLDHFSLGIKFSF
ncbi:hypothetical protein M5M_03945 [Simiduia agarivorans SA1 = DSM 21679]|uniref:Outer membrane protein beta-barrel domain-containing protein n=2 Tax=Simiduia TaxID=447467 RepID=K4KJ30_SIMAS|nr:hypothetical protein M5M_03945 [Simiduia agarivorans SA1 = DSM 21679]